MRYLCMVCYQQETLDDLSKPEFDALVAEALAYDDKLREGGHYLYSGALQSVATATTLRINSGKVQAIDGPFAETKETCWRLHRNRSCAIMKLADSPCFEHPAGTPRVHRGPSDPGARTRRRSQEVTLMT